MWSIYKCSLPCVYEWPAMHICVRQKQKESSSGHHPLLRSLIILAFFLPNIEVSLSRSVSFTSLSFSSLQWFDVPNHFQPWTPHERQQALAIIGCWKNERGRGQRRGETLKKKRGGQGRNGDRIRSVPISRSRVIISPAFCSFAKPPFVPSPTFPSLLSLPAIYLNCTHSASTHWQQWGRNWFGDLRMPNMRNATHWRRKECVSGKRGTKLNERFSSIQHPQH